jgi:hypothetical protein
MLFPLLVSPSPPGGSLSTEKALRNVDLGVVLGSYNPYIIKKDESVRDASRTSWYSETA